MPSLRKAFHIGDVLSVLTQRDVSPRGAAGARALQDHVAGRALLERERHLFEAQIRDEVEFQFPELCVFGDADIPPRELLGEWLQRRASEFGEYVSVQPMDPLPPFAPLEIPCASPEDGHDVLSGGLASIGLHPKHS